MGMSTRVISVGLEQTQPTAKVEPESQGSSREQETNRTREKCPPSSLYCLSWARLPSSIVSEMVFLGSEGAFVDSFEGRTDMLRGGRKWSFCADVFGQRPRILHELNDFFARFGLYEQV